MDLLRETAVAFARVGGASPETAVAFAGEKWVYFVRFVVAEVPPVSTLAVQGRAVVMVVSCWPPSVGAEVLLVSKPPRGCVPCANLFALRGPMVGVSANKFVRRTRNGPNSAFYGALGEFFAPTGTAATYRR